MLVILFLWSTSKLQAKMPFIPTSQYNLTWLKLATGWYLINFCKIKQAKFFSIIADEATDVANTEQLSISIHFVDEDGVPYEWFFCFHACETRLTGIICKLDDRQLEPKLLWGQAYDGTGIMPGQSKGAAACIASKYSNAIYTHSASHRLNLCVMKFFVTFPAYRLLLWKHCR